MDLPYKSSEVCIKTRSTPAWQPSKGQVPEQTTVKWSIAIFPLLMLREVLNVQPPKITTIKSSDLKFHISQQIPKVSTLESSGFKYNLSCYVEKLWIRNSTSLEELPETQTIFIDLS